MKLTAPYNPATNGQAERFVQTMKNALRRVCVRTTIMYNLRYRNYFFNTEGCLTTKKSPSELMFGRQIRSRLDFIKLVIQSKTNINRYKVVRNFHKGERVSCRDYTGKQKWRFGRIHAKLGTLHFLIRLDDGRSWKRHVNQMRSIGNATPKENYDCGPPPHEEEDGTEVPVQDQSIYEDAVGRIHGIATGTDSA